MNLPTGKFIAPRAGTGSYTESAYFPAATTSQSVLYKIDYIKRRLVCKRTDEGLGMKVP